MVWRFLFVWEHSFASSCTVFTICYTPYICMLICSLSVYVSIYFRRKYHQQLAESFCSGDFSRNRYANIQFLDIFHIFFFKMFSIMLSWDTVYNSEFSVHIVNLTARSCFSTFRYLVCMKSYLYSETDELKTGFSSSPLTIRNSWYPTLAFLLR